MGEPSRGCGGKLSDFLCGSWKSKPVIPISGPPGGPSIYECNSVPEAKQQERVDRAVERVREEVLEGSGSERKDDPH